MQMEGGFCSLIKENAGDSGLSSLVSLISGVSVSKGLTGNSHWEVPVGQETSSALFLQCMQPCSGVALGADAVSRRKRLRTEGCGRFRLSPHELIQALDVSGTPARPGAEAPRLDPPQ